MQHFIYVPYFDSQGFIILWFQIIKDYINMTYEIIYPSYLCEVNFQIQTHGRVMRELLIK